MDSSELQEIMAGGASKYGIVSVLAGILSFIIGFFEGYQNPNECND